MIDWAQLIISNILVAMLIGGLAWLVGRSGQRAHLAHLLWIGFFVKLVTPPIIILAIMVPAEWLPQQLSQPSPFIASAETASLEFPESATLIADGVLPESNRMGVDERPAWPKIGWWHVAVVVWCIGFVYLTSRGVVRFVRFHRLLQREGTVDEEATQFVGNLIAAQYPEQRARLRRTPQVLRIPLRVSPMLFGIGRRAVIVCPDILWKSFDEDERQSFLAHETAHYCRRDHWVRWLEWLVTAAYWWFPAVHVARKQLERHEEACCDAWAVNQLKSPPRRYPADTTC